MNDRHRVRRAELAVDPGTRTGMRDPLNRWTGLVVGSLIVLTVISCAVMLGNDFVQDDLPIIARDPGIHSLNWRRIFLEPYWPAPFSRDLYRPFASLLFSIEWLIGSGSPLTFRLVSLTLYVLSVLSCFILARTLLPLSYAWAVAGLFAVHPVHVEAVALAVNQGELVVGIILLMTTAWYIQRRHDPSPLGWRENTIIAVLTLVGGLFKEHAVVLPGLLALVELVVYRGEGTVLARLIKPWRIYALSAIAIVLLLGPRAYLFEGDLGGSFTAEALRGLSISERWVTMLGVVPRWFYLTLWPSHLSGDYSPQVIVATTSFGVLEMSGLILLALAAWLAIRTATATPVIAFGLGFAVITLLPVSNLLFPTGIVLAERTLYSPSAGVLLAVVGIAYLILEGRSHQRLSRYGGGFALAALLSLGIWRSFNRYQTWRTPSTQFSTLLNDAPLSYRAWANIGDAYLAAGNRHDGQRFLKRSLALWPGTVRIYLSLGDSYRLADECDSAIPYYLDGLAQAKQNGQDLAMLGSVRWGLAACFVWLGDYESAREHASWEANHGRADRISEIWLRLIDSAARIKAPPRTIRFPVESLE